MPLNAWEIHVVEDGSLEGHGPKIKRNVNQEVSMRFIPIISLSILVLLLTACSADTGSSVNASANLSQDQPHQDIAALPLTDSGLSLLVKDYTYTPKPQADPGVCLKIAFRQLCVLSLIQI